MWWIVVKVVNRVGVIRHKVVSIEVVSGLMVMITEVKSPLHPPRNLLINRLLLSPRFGLGLPSKLHHSCLRNIHLLQHIRIHIVRKIVIEPRTPARLPLRAANDAEFRHAATRYVVAPFLQLHHRRAIVASLPPFFLGGLHEALGVRILGAISRAVEFAVAYHADLCLAAAAFAVLAAAGGAGAEVDVDVTWFYPFAAAPGGTVDSVAGHVFLVLSVPVFLEFVVEELVDVFQGDVF